MKIEDGVKYDFNDVLIRPKRSILESRKEVNLNRKFQFSCGRVWDGVPIVSANMDTTGTIEMGKVLSEYNMLTCLSKHQNESQKYHELLTKEKGNMALSFGLQDREMLLNDAFAKEFSDIYI